VNQVASSKLFGQPVKFREPGLFTSQLITDALATQQTAFSTYAINNAVGSPFAVPFGSIASARRIIVKALSGGPFVLHITSAFGAAQKLPMSGEAAFFNPASPITALGISGVGSVEIYLAA
jgi:hypothetical protein